MSNPIVNQDFLLHSDVACELYHDYAAKMDIIDYHNHLSLADIATNRRFENLTQLWLEGDHYKWRAMRALGIDEKYISGKASDAEKFERWAKAVPYTMMNPLYHWTHMELNKPFGVKELLSEASSSSIYQQVNALLQSFPVRSILESFRVQILCTTDDPTDNLVDHQSLKNMEGVDVYPTWRADQALDFRNTKTWKVYCDKLSEVSNINISSYNQYIEALKSRHDFFEKLGCRASDQGLESPFPIEDYTDSHLNLAFEKLLSGKSLNSIEQAQLKSDLFYQLAKWNSEKGWVQQYHVGAYRDVNSKGVTNVGQACGFDSIADFSYAHSMGRFFNKLNNEESLAKTIVYNLNPKDSAMVATMMGNFNEPGNSSVKMQYGAAWWFLDQKDGILDHLKNVSNFGLLCQFVGMLTDSRSFLSFSRHEYFRRILCEFLGDAVKKGELPNDKKWLGKLIQDISYHNAKNYFKF